MKRYAMLITIALVSVGVLFAGGGADSGASGTSAPSDTKAASEARAADFPVELENCGSVVRIEAEPRRIFMVNNDSIAMLDTLGLLDRVVARTSEPFEGVHSEEAVAMLAAVPMVSKERNIYDGSIVALESVLAQRPDLVLSAENAVDRTILEQSGIPLYSAPAFCDDPAQQPKTASYELVYDQLRTFAKMFGKAAEAENAIRELKDVVSGIDISGPGSAGTGMAVYVSASGTLSPYGAGSMITPLFQAAGLENVYADEPQRVFDASVEDILGRNPETVVVLYSSFQTFEDAVASFNAVSGVEALSAVRNNRVTALQFPFTDPPTPLSVQGAARFAERLADLP